MLFRPVGKGLFIIKQHAMKLFFLSYLPYWLFTFVQNLTRKSISSLLIIEPALDGLHYLYSYDGYHWDSIAGSWLKPEKETRPLIIIISLNRPKNRNMPQFDDA